MTDYPNWFAISAKWYFEKHLPGLASKKINALQIGAYTGDATLWMFENFLLNENSVLTDVDTLKGSEEAVHDTFDWDDVERVYDNKTHQYSQAEKLIKF